MTFKYVAAGGYLSYIERVEIERETVGCVWIGGIRKEKRSLAGSVHDTFEGAKNYLIAEAVADLDAGRQMVARKSASLVRIMNLKEGK